MTSIYELRDRSVVKQHWSASVGVHISGETLPVCPLPACTTRSSSTINDNRKYFSVDVHSNA